MKKSKPKDKQLLRLKEVVDVQKVKFGITDKRTGKSNPTFSFFFDYRTRRLGYRFRVPVYDPERGRYIGKPVNRFFSYINDKNWKKYFKSNTSLVPDVAKTVSEEIDKHLKKYENYQDEFDFGWWKERFYNRTITGGVLSPETYKQNRRMLEPYYYWILEEHPIGDEIGTHPDNAIDWLEEYLKYRQKGDENRKPKPYTPWSNATQMTCYRNIKGFYNWIAKKTKGKFPFDIVRALEIKKEKTQRRGVNSSEMEKIVEFIATKKDDAYWGKFILMLRLQLKTGMRVGELVSIRTDRINEEERTIMIDGKTGERTLPFNHEEDDVIWSDIMEKKTEGSTYLFYQTRVQFYPKQRHKIEIDVDLESNTTDSYYQQRFREMRDTLGLPGKGIISTHSIRRHFITTFVHLTGKRDLCRLIVGHSTTRMTDEYVDSEIAKDTRITIPTPGV